MKKFKTTLLSASLMALASGQVLASFNHQEAASLFESDSVDNFQIAPLSVKEMQNTKGAHGVPGGIYGMGVAGWSYAGEVAGGKEFTFGGLAKALSTGAVVGAFTGPIATSARYYGASRAAAAMGFGWSRTEN